MIHRLLIPLLITPIFAAEHTIEKSPFRIEHHFTATAIPSEAGLLELDPLSWSDFTIEKLADHGTQVKKGDLLITFKRENYDRHLEDLKIALSLKEIAYATQKLALTKLDQEVKIALTASRRAKEMADEDLTYFTQFGRPAAEATVAQNLIRQQLRLDSTKEELKQLKAMYEADDLTEETEEIILVRQKASVKAAEFSMKEAKRNAKLTLDVSLPRRAESVQQVADSATIAFEKADKDLPRSLQTAKLSLDSATIAIEREKLEIERLVKDGALLEWKAPMDGIFFFGALEDGRWSLGDLSKFLVVGGKLPLRRTVASLAPTKADLPLNARIAAKIASSIAKDSKLVVTIPGREDLGLVASVKDIEPAAGTDSLFGLTLSVEWPQDFQPAPSTIANCIAVVYENVDAMSLPSKALKPGSDGSWSVEVKLADGKTEKRSVQRGRVSGETIEILGGLEVGQVIIVPD